MLIPRMAKLLRHGHGNTLWQHAPPKRASARPYGLQHIRSRRDARFIQWQVHMDFKMQRAPRGKTIRVLPPGNRHERLFVIVAEKRKPSVCPVGFDPRIAVMQCDEIFLFRTRPFQAQSGQSVFHPVDNGQRTTVVPS